MPTGLRKFAVTMGTLAANTEAAVAALSKTTAVIKPTANGDRAAALADIQRRLVELQRQIDTAPAVVAAREIAKSIAERIAELEERLLAAGEKPPEELLREMRSLKTEKLKSDLVLADIQQEIDARFAALREDERRIISGAGTTTTEDVSREVTSFRASITRSAVETRDRVAAVLDEIEGLTYEKFRTLNATEFDIEDFVQSQREKIQTLRELGLGENLDAYAVGFERLRRGDLSPQLTREFTVMLQQIRQTITTLGGTAGRTFNFAALEREINEMARNARDAARDTRLGRTSGSLGKDRSKSGCEEAPSLSILRGAGVLR